MIIYIAGPMTGLPDFNYPAFNEAADQLRAAGYEVLSPVDVDEPGEHYQSRAWHWYMRRGLKLLLDADAVAVLPGWEKSRGASLEVQVATQLVMPVEPVAFWLKQKVPV